MLRIGVTLLSLVAVSIAAAIPVEGNGQLMEDFSNPARTNSKRQETFRDGTKFTHVIFDKVGSKPQEAKTFEKKKLSQSDSGAKQINFKLVPEMMKKLLGQEQETPDQETQRVYESMGGLAKTKVKRQELAGGNNHTVKNSIHGRDVSSNADAQGNSGVKKEEYSSFRKAVYEGMGKENDSMNKGKARNPRKLARDLTRQRADSEAVVLDDLVKREKHEEVDDWLAASDEAAKYHREITSIKKEFLEETGQRAEETAVLNDPVKRQWHDKTNEWLEEQARPEKILKRETPGNQASGLEDLKEEANEFWDARGAWLIPNKGTYKLPKPPGFWRRSQVVERTKQEAKSAKILKRETPGNQASGHQNSEEGTDDFWNARGASLIPDESTPGNQASGHQNSEEGADDFWAGRLSVRAREVTSKLPNLPGLWRRSQVVERATEDAEPAKIAETKDKPIQTDEHMEAPLEEPRIKDRPIQTNERMEEPLDESEIQIVVNPGMPSWVTDAEAKARRINKYHRPDLFMEEELARFLAARIEKKKRKARLGAQRGRFLDGEDAAKVQANPGVERRSLSPEGENAAEEEIPRYRFPDGPEGGMQRVMDNLEQIASDDEVLGRH
ncbi:hypothetical protein CDD82_6237 [Ophiocordyceps australis]|uniref:Uncharacterized protein n=1 Tax=Ophiocordyceps australis TaxID=1399860 RepID=A0A2C5XGV8_9HYPO|nr:hypothetical protein CDD82_6237 [Ophiocordyceps australis]